MKIDKIRARVSAATLHNSGSDFDGMEILSMASIVDHVSAQPSLSSPRNSFARRVRGKLMRRQGLVGLDHRSRKQNGAAHSAAFTREKLFHLSHRFEFYANSVEESQAFRFIFYE